MSSQLPLTRIAAACPLCGERPQCGMSQGQTDCWCFHCDFPPELLALVPDPQIGVACICQHCVKASHDILAEAEKLTLEALLRRRRESLR